jgi:hypothetical protein
MCLNLCKTCLVFVVCPLVVFWMYKSGNLEKIFEKAGNTASKGCDCCSKFCSTVSAKLNGSCFDKLCNTDSCKQCCGLTKCFGAICGFFKGCCKDNCFKNALNFDAICKCLKSTFSCDFSKLDCCDAKKGCQNPLVCCGSCPCFSKCGKLDGCTCCEKSATATQGFCSDVFGRCCNCCYSFKKAAGSTGQKSKSPFSPQKLILTLN